MYQCDDYDVWREYAEQSGSFDPDPVMVHSFTFEESDYQSGSVLLRISFNANSYEDLWSWMTSPSNSMSQLRETLSDKEGVQSVGRLRSYWSMDASEGVIHLEVSDEFDPGTVTYDDLEAILSLDRAEQVYQKLRREACCSDQFKEVDDLIRSLRQLQTELAEDVVRDRLDKRRDPTRVSDVVEDYLDDRGV